MYKKIIFLLVSAMLFSVSGCGKSGSEEDTKPEKTIVQKNKNEKNVKTGWTSEIEEIYKPLDYDTVDKFKQTCEVNGKKCEVSITYGDKNEYGDFTSVNFDVNGSGYKLEDTYFYGLSYLALAELDGEDIILFTGHTSEDSWNELVTLRYDGKRLEPLTVGVDYNGNDDVRIGFKPENGIELSDYSDFKMWVKTSSRGMWDIKRTYTVRDETIIIHQENRYEVNIKEFLQPYESYEKYNEYFGIGKEEYDRLFDGYVMCHKYYYGMEEGTYFTVLYDNGHDDIYVRTDSGEEYWTEVPEYPDGEEISERLFYMAG